MIYSCNKRIPLGSCCFRQPNAKSHCKFLHGYRLEAEILIGCNELDDNNWVYDFGGFKEIKKILEDQFDHTTVISSLDPHLNIFKGLHNLGVIDLRVMDGVGIEKFSQYILEVVNEIIKKDTNGRCFVVSVQVFEHEQNSAIAMTTRDYSKVIQNDITTQEGDLQDAEILKNIDKAISETKNYIVDNIEKVREEVDKKLIASLPKEELVEDNVPPLNNKITKGWSDPFAGTSWGKK